MVNEGFELNLVISCFITHDRRENLCNRFEMFLGTLESYAKISWDNIYVFVELDLEFSGRENDIIQILENKFACNSIYFNNFRIVDQKSWKDFFDGKLGHKKLFWFTQNDDHPYLDNDINYLIAGCEQLASYKDQLASIYLSHWPEMLRLSGKNSSQKVVQNFIEFNGFLIDAIQIFNSKMIYEVFFKTDWKGKEYKRIDTLLVDKSIWGEEQGNIKRCDQKIIVPMKEICRKFAGYSHVRMSSVPPLKVTYRLESEKPTNDIIRRNMTAEHESFWTKGNSFSVPEKWIEISSALYGTNRSKTDPVKYINLIPNKPIGLQFRIVHKFKGLKRSLRKLKKYFAKNYF